MLQPLELYLDFVFRFFDRLVFGDLTSKRIDAALEEVTQTLAYSQKHRDDIDHLYRLFEAMDQKAGALLTHISIIVAGLAILYQDSQTSLIWKRILETQIIFYLLLTFLCLRAIRMTAPWFDQIASMTRDDVARLKLEFWKRRRCYNVATAITILATISVVVTLILHGTRAF
jgi:hypothetical protein